MDRLLSLRDWTWCRMSLMSRLRDWIRCIMSLMSKVRVCDWQVGIVNKMLRNWTRTFRRMRRLFFLSFPFISIGAWDQVENMMLWSRMIRGMRSGNNRGFVWCYESMTFNMTTVEKLDKSTVNINASNTLYSLCVSSNRPAEWGYQRDQLKRRERALHDEKVLLCNRYMGIHWDYYVSLI